MKCYADERDHCHNPSACGNAGRCVYEEALNAYIVTKSNHPKDEIHFQFQGITAAKIVGISWEEISMEDQPKRNGSPEFYTLLDKMADIHNKKSHDYAMASNPFSNFERAGTIASWFTNPVDIAFAALIGVKLARMAELKNNNKTPNNESLEDTQLDLATYSALWGAYTKSQPKICPKCGHQALFHNHENSGKCAFCDCTLIII